MSPARQIALLVAALVSLVSCTGAEERPQPTTTVADVGPPGTDNPLAYPIYTDPAIPIYAKVGTRFGIALPAQPAAGFRWDLVNRPDPQVLLPLGSEFSTDSTVIPLGEDEAAFVITFVATADGETSIGLRYVGANGQAAPEERSATFTVTINAEGQAPPAEAPDATEPP
jgi:predicted secreted protein